MRKTLSALAVVGALLLSGCMKPPVRDTYPFPKGDYPEYSPYRITEEDIYCGSADELKAAIEDYRLEEIPLPDGSTVSKYDAVYGYYDTKRGCGNNILGFDFAFYRMLGSADTVSDTEWKKAAKGDVLENGLVVEAAFCKFSGEKEQWVGENITETCLVFDGEITLPGELKYLLRTDLGEGDGYEEGDLLFEPDRQSCEYPEPISFFPDKSIPSYPYYFLGNVKRRDYAGFDLEALFGGGQRVSAAVTIKDISFNISRANKTIEGTIVDIKLM